MSNDSKPRASRPDLKDIRAAAQRLIASGLVPLPLPNGQKSPLLEEWETAVISSDKVDELFTAGCNIGLRLDTATDVDLDCPEALALSVYFLKSTDARWGRATSRNSHLLYQVENSRYEKFCDPMEKGPKQTLLEIRCGNGHQSMIPPSVHPEGEQLRWEAGERLQFEPWKYPELWRAAARIAAGALLSRYLKEGKRHDAWLCLGGALARAEWPLQEAVHFAEVWTRVFLGGRKDLVQAVEDSYRNLESGEKNVAGLKKLEEYLPKPVIRKLAQWLNLRRVKSDPLDLTDDSNAQAIFTEHGEDLRFLPNEGRGGLWTFWNDVIWQRDREGRVKHVAAGTLKKKADQLTADARDAKFIEKVRSELLNVPGVRSALERLSWYPELVVAPDGFDANPWLIGLQNGIYNLQFDRLEEGTREHLVSRQMQAAYDPSATCPRWLTALERAQPAEEVREFLQRLAGACLLGMQTEHGFIFNYGKGANFKTAFSEVIRRVMGDDYAATPNEELFFKGNQEVPRNYVADIHGMRLLTTNEKNEGSEWNLEFIKRILGGQQLNACRKYCESFSFVPTARIIAAANNKPRLNELDEATRRRFLLVPWEVVIPTVGEILSSTESDPNVILRCLKSGARIPFEQLMALLLEEHNGILNWTLAGARDFISRGSRLEPPTSVLAATNSYFEDEDIIGKFVKECCIVTPLPGELTAVEVVRLLQQSEKGTSTKLLHDAFTAWSQFGKYAWSQRKVTQRLEKVDGVVAVRGTGNRMFMNLVLKETAKASSSKPENQEPPEDEPGYQESLTFGGS